MEVLADIFSEDQTKIEVTIPALYKDLLKSVPGATYNTKRFIWTMPLTYPGYLSLTGTFKHELKIGPALTQWVNDHYRDVIYPSLVLRTQVSADGYPDLYPHQNGGVHFLTTAKRAILADGLGAGKAQPLSEPILTPKGWVRMGDIKVGDYVIGRNGKPVQVLAVYGQGVRDIYKVSFKDGAFTYADGDHLWDVQSLKNTGTNRHTILTTKDLLEYGLTTPSTGQFKWRIPLVDPVEFDSDYQFVVSPYIMGAVLGDGSIRDKNVSLTNVDSEVLNRVAEELPDTVSLVQSSKEGITYGLTRVAISGGNPILDEFRRLGLTDKGSRDKFIPSQYLYASAKDRLALLQGLMDTDGTTSRNTHSFCTVSMQLAADVRELVQSLGGTAVWNYHKRPELGNYDPVVLTIRLPDHLNPFYISRKANLVATKEKYQLSRFITKIEYSHREEAQCIAVDAPDRLYVTRDYVVTHNTRTAFASVKRLAQMGENPFPVLVVAPNSTKIGWKREIEAVWPGLTVTVVSGTAAQRRKQLKTPAHVYIMNWEAVKGHSRLAPYGSIALNRCKECGGADEKITEAKCHTHVKELNNIAFQTVIGDEIHRIKDASTQQARAFKAATGDAPFRFALTGTPVANAPDDLWSILNWLYPDAFPSKTKFIDRYLDTSVNAFGAMTVIGVKAHMEKEFFAILDPMLRRMPKEVVLPFLPPIVYERRDVEMNPKQKKAYEQMRDKMLAELDNGDLLITTSPLTKMTRMLQFASAFAELREVEVKDKKTGEMKKTLKAFLSEPSAKLDAFIDDIDDFQGESVVVFSPSKQLINMLAARLDKLKIRYGRITGDEDDIERQIHMDNFQEGRTQFILCTTGAGGTGVTLTRASVAVYLGRPWSNIDSEQSEGRVHRLGSEIHEKIVYRDYVTLDTVEEAVFEALTRKGDMLQYVLRDQDLIRKVLESGHIPEDVPDENEEKDESDNQ